MSTLLGSLITKCIADRSSSRPAGALPLGLDRIKRRFTWDTSCCLCLDYYIIWRLFLFNGFLDDFRGYRIARSTPTGCLTERSSEETFLWSKLSAINFIPHQVPPLALGGHISRAWPPCIGQCRLVRSPPATQYPPHLTRMSWTSDGPSIGSRIWSFDCRVGVGKPPSNGDEQCGS